MDNVITIISVAASILSIIGFILSIKCKDSIINKICYILIIILTVATQYCPKYFFRCDISHKVPVLCENRS